MNNALAIKEVSKRYAKHLALDHVSFEVKEGSIFGLLGPNGAGKTTLIRMITQITAPDSGQISFFGEPLSKTHIPLVGYLPEERGLYRNMKVGEQLIYLAELKGVKRDFLKKELKEWMERLEVTEWWDKKTSELSKGMQQKIQFIATVLHRPKFIILDEPFSGFDPVNAAIIRDEVLRLRELGATILFSTHRMESVEELCDEIALIHQAKLVLQGKTHELRQNFKEGTWQITAKDHETVNWQELESQGIKVTNQKDGSISLQLQVGSSKELLAWLANHPELEWSSIKEQIPSLNDIFIKLVKGE